MWQKFQKIFGIQTNPASYRFKPLFFGGSNCWFLGWIRILHLELFFWTIFVLLPLGNTNGVTRVHGIRLSSEAPSMQLLPLENKPEFLSDRLPSREQLGKWLYYRTWIQGILEGIPLLNHFKDLEVAICRTCGYLELPFFFVFLWQRYGYTQNILEPQTTIYK